MYILTSMSDTMSTKKNLRQRKGGGWAVVYYVPHELRKIVGKREIVRGLGTKDFKVACSRKNQVLLAIQREVADMVNPDVEAKEIAKKYDHNNEFDALWLTEKAEKIEKERGLKAAKRFYGIASMLSTPISFAMEKWLEEGDGIKDSTSNRYRTAVEDFVEWAGDIPIKDVDRQMAGEYVRYVKIAKSKKTKKSYSPRTQQFKINTLAQLWRWCIQRGILDYEKPSPWIGQFSAAPGQRKQKAPTVKGLRGIQKEEARIWLNAVSQTKYKNHSAMRDLIILAWHTGARANDICELTVPQIEIDEENNVYWLDIINGKTKANKRIMPVVSPEAQAVLKQRIENAQNGELFPELERGGEDNKKYHNLQKAINRIRQKQEVLRGIPVDMHSFRRKFSNACYDAGLDDSPIARLMGHEAPTLHDGTYNKYHEARKRVLADMRLVYEELGELTERK